MFSKQSFLDSVQDEIRICKHLHSKITPEMLDYSPGPNMRTTLELLRYLTHCGSTPAEALVKNDWSGVAERQEDVKGMEASEFPARMDEQLVRLQECLAGIPEAELDTREAPLPWGSPTTLGAGLINTSLKFLASYRLQLFIHVKAAGAKELSTYNAWLGMDSPEE